MSFLTVLRVMLKWVAISDNGVFSRNCWAMRGRRLRAWSLGVVILGWVLSESPLLFALQKFIPPLTRGAGDEALVCEFLSMFFIDVVFICYFVMAFFFLRFRLTRFEEKGNCFSFKSPCFCGAFVGVISPLRLRRFSPL